MEPTRLLVDLSRLVMECQSFKDGCKNDSTVLYSTVHLLSFAMKSSGCMVGSEGRGDSRKIQRPAED